MFRKILFCLALMALCFGSQVMAADKPNINTATAEELAASPVLGPDLAQKIVDYRESVGDIASADDLKEIDGIDDAKMKDIQDSFEIKAVASADCNC